MARKTILRVPTSFKISKFEGYALRYHRDIGFQRGQSRLPTRSIAISKFLPWQHLRPRWHIYLTDSPIPSFRRPIIKTSSTVVSRDFKQLHHKGHLLLFRKVKAHCTDSNLSTPEREKPRRHACWARQESSSRPSSYCCGHSHSPQIILLYPHHTRRARPTFSQCHIQTSPSLDKATWVGRSLDPTVPIPVQSWWLSSRRWYSPHQPPYSGDLPTHVSPTRLWRRCRLGQRTQTLSEPISQSTGNAPL